MGDWSTKVSLTSRSDRLIGGFHPNRWGGRTGELQKHLLTLGHGWVSLMKQVGNYTFDNAGVPSREGTFRPFPPLSPTRSRGGWPRNASPTGSGSWAFDFAETAIVPNVGTNPNPQLPDAVDECRRIRNLMRISVLHEPYV
jgi:hypothetical protein